MMIRQFIILILIFIFGSSCDTDNLDLYNCQDPFNECYLYPTQDLDIQSYSPTEIVIGASNLDQIDMISIQRIKSGIADTSFILSKNNNNLFIDSVDIELNQNYDYIIRNYSDFGISDAGFVIDLNHDFPAIVIDSLQIKPIDENSIDIDWFYDLDEVFMKNYDPLLWKIIKLTKPIDSVEWEDTSIIELSEDFSSDGYYSYYDNDDINLYDSLKYSIYLEIDGFQSDTVTQNLRVNFPKMDFINLIPLNSHAISIHWGIDNSNNDNISSVKITNQYYKDMYGQNTYFYEIGSGQTQDFIIDDLIEYNDEIVAGTPIDYTIKWCGTSACDSLNFTANTFRFKDMQYIPSMINIPFSDDEIISTDAFYIDIYEVNEYLYDNPLQNIYNNESINEYPKSSISIQDARNWCDNRSSVEQSTLEGDESSGQSSLFDFRLPTESEWYVASAIKYNSYNEQIEEQYDYTVQVGDGTITCAFGNILNCTENGPLTVGYYNGNNYPDYQESISPNGLYDCNGNVKEWVEKSSNFNHSDDSGNVIMSGDFQSSELQAKNNYFIYEELNFQGHPTIGFRTVIPAPPIINIIENE